jgi:hypothetical protein
LPPSEPTPQRFEEALALLKARVEGHYGIGVLSFDVAAPFSGDLDGQEIRIDPEFGIELMVFNLIHLFGHTVQWNLLGRVPDIGTKPPGQYSPADLEEVTSYERDASRYGQALLHETGLQDLAPWLADLSASDITYLEHFYATGIKGALADFRKTGQPLLDPLPIPDFKPRRLNFRTDGVVI